MSELIYDANLKYHYNDKYIFFTKSFLSQWYGSFRGQECFFVTRFDNGMPSVQVNCAEQAMMVHKAALFGDYDAIKGILSTTNANNQKKIGRRVKNFDQKIWDEKKFEIVTKINIEKFSQNEDLKKLLLDTKNKTLVEAAPWDKIWGIGMDIDHPYILEESQWKGSNLLGKALMQTREFFKRQNVLKEFSPSKKTSVDIMETVNENSTDLIKNYEDVNVKKPKVTEDQYRKLLLDMYLYLRDTMCQEGLMGDEGSEKIERQLIKMGIIDE